ncbi:hypothetical protein OsccyDRAFT_4950 [Leptolyngbyaceae cyanobacterium JSC-12]|nr:hypothetical protein OsccyDRAFT_4950 [Leptolyngbyaceae cyanobacterium JSC-12]
MTGFLRGFFGSKPKDEALAQPEVKPPKPAREGGRAYYLDIDDARTMGDVEYMRTAKKVRRTFPKTVNNEEMELEKEVSSINMSDRKLGTQVPKSSMGSVATSTPVAESNDSVSTNAQVSERRKADSSLDMFRNMAKDIRK